jgi:hypothetical protein
MSEMDIRREESLKLKNELTEKLKALGVVTDNVDHLMEPEEKTPEQYAEDAEDYQLQNDAQAYQTFELVQENLFGIHAVDIVFGKCRLGFVGQGLDIFDLLPLCESIKDLKHKLDIVSRAATANHKSNKN